MNTFFDESGCLNTDDLIIKQPSFMKIMEDGVVTKEEVENQKAHVVSLLKAIEADFSPEQIERVRELLAEISVLIAVNNMVTN
jgi:hypothetical protein